MMQLINTIKQGSLFGQKISLTIAAVYTNDDKILFMLFTPVCLKSVLL